MREFKIGDKVRIVAGDSASSNDHDGEIGTISKIGYSESLRKKWVELAELNESQSGIWLKELVYINNDWDK